MKDRISATYLVETPWPVDQAAEAIAGMSTSTFVKLPGEEQLARTYRPRVESIRELEPAAQESLPGSRPPKEHAGTISYHRAEVRISFPMENMGTNLPTLLATVMGSYYELSQFSGLRLLNIDLPEAFAKAYPGPQFGIDGTRRLTGVFQRPLIGTIIKPAVGLTPEQTAEIVSQLAPAGVDFIKDDEMMANPPHSPLKKRVEAVMRVLNEFEQKTGKKIMYAFNITDELDAMLRHHDVVISAGGTCVMVSINQVGLGAVSALRRDAAVAIHGHRNGWGMLTRCPGLGIEFTAYQKLWRLVGVDQLHVGGLQSKFWEDDNSVVRAIRSVQAPLSGTCPIMPVVGSAQWGGQAPETYKQTGSVDLIYVAGGGIMAHPGGCGAGARAIRQAWQAAVDGIALEDYALDHNELKQSLAKFGGIQKN